LGQRLAQNPASRAGYRGGGFDIAIERGLRPGTRRSRLRRFGRVAVKASTTNPTTIKNTKTNKRFHFCQTFGLTVYLHRLKGNIAD
jgi:hypothetical protein